MGIRGIVLLALCGCCPLAWMAPVTTARAASIIYEVPFTGQNGGDVPVPRFDVTNGWLQAVVVEIVEYSATNTYRLDNDRDEPVEAQCSKSHPVLVSLPGYEGMWFYGGEFTVRVAASASLQPDDGDGPGSMNGGSDEAQVEAATCLSYPLVVTNQYRLGGTIGSGQATYSVRFYAADIQASEGVECTSTHGGTAGRLRVRYIYDLPDANPWTSTALSNDLRNVFHDGSQFVGYTHAAGRNIAVSTDGSSWVGSGALPSGSIALGPGADGRWFSLVGREEGSGWGATCILDLRSSDNGQVWTQVGELYNSGLYRPVGGEICAHPDVLLLKQVNQWGPASGWVSGPPEDRAYIVQNLTGLWTTSVAMRTLRDFHCTNGDVYAMRTTEIMRSLDGGATWNTLCNTGPTFSTRRLHDTYQGRFFVSADDGSLQVFNSLGEKTVVNLPCRQAADFAYNGSHAVALSEDAVYYSGDHMRTWKVYVEPELIPQALTHDDQRFVVIVRRENDTMALTLPSTTTELSPLYRVPIQAELRSGIVNYPWGMDREVKLLDIRPDSVSATWFQFEMSRDLGDWYPYGLPTGAGATVPYCITDSPASRAFFRAHAVEP